MVFQHTRIRNCLYLLPNRSVTGMTGCAACRTMRMGGIALKMGVLFERSEFRPFSNDGHSQRNGSFGRPPFAMPKRFARNQRFRLSAYLGSFFFGGTKKNEHMRVQGCFPAFWSHRKKKYIVYVNSKFTESYEGQRESFLYSDCTERKRAYADVNGKFTK